MSKTINLAAVDIGNASIKAIFHDNTKFCIPNVIAKEERIRDYIDLESDPLEGIHVQITSSALKGGKGIYVAGELAMKYPENDELNSNSQKHDSDQSLVMLLLTVALHAAKDSPSDAISAEYALGTGLPIEETKKGARDGFRQKLIDTVHQVEFLNTPKYFGKRVNLKFTDVIVSAEGLAAYMELAVQDNGKVKDDDITNRTVQIWDIGGLTTDNAIFEKTKIDNKHSRGYRLGISHFLDKIIDEVEVTYGYRIRSRKELVDIIVNGNPDEKDHIFVYGNRTCIESITTKNMRSLANELYKNIILTWSAVPSSYVAFLIGGGSVVLKDYIEQINKAEKKLPLRYLSKEQSIWIIAESYMKILKLKMQKTVKEA